VKPTLEALRRLMVNHHFHVREIKIDPNDRMIIFMEADGTAQPGEDMRGVLVAKMLTSPMVQVRVRGYDD